MPKFTWEKVPGSCLETSLDNHGQRQYRAVYRYGRNKSRTRTCSTPEEALLARKAKLKKLYFDVGQQHHPEGGPSHSYPNYTHQSRNTQGHNWQSKGARWAPYPTFQHTVPVRQGARSQLICAAPLKMLPMVQPHVAAHERGDVLQRVPSSSMNPKTQACLPPTCNQHQNSLAGRDSEPGHMAQHLCPAKPLMCAGDQAQQNRAPCSVLRGPSASQGPSYETAPEATVPNQRGVVSPPTIPKQGLQTGVGGYSGQYTPTNPAYEEDPSSDSWLSRPSQQGIGTSMDQHEAVFSPGTGVRKDMQGGLPLPGASGTAGVKDAVPNDVPLPADLGGCIAHLTEVYDERLRAHGCKRLRILRKLAAGAYGSVHMGYTVLTGNCSKSFNQAGSYGAMYSDSCCTAACASGRKGSEASLSDEGQQQGDEEHPRVMHTAVKVYRSACSDFKRECETLQLLVGKCGFVQLLAVGFVVASSSQQQDQQQPVKEQARSFPCLVLQLAERTLDDMDEPCTEQQAKKWTRQLLEGLAILHSGKLSGTVIVHRDVKPLNLLLDDSGNLMIADFSGSAVVKSTASNVNGGTMGNHWPRMASIAGSECYMAPEVGNSSYAGGYDCTVDSHAVGMVALGLLLGGRKQLMKHAKQLPLGVSAQSLSVMNFVQDVILGHENPTLPFSGEFRDFMSCSSTPGCRQTPWRLLQHPWVAL